VSSIYLSLNKQIDANRLLQQIQNLINKTSVTPDSILQISILSVGYDDLGIIPKLEYKGDLNERSI
jgi:hypothetical protein